MKRPEMFSVGQKQSSDEIVSAAKGLPLSDAPKPVEQVN